MARSLGVAARRNQAGSLPASRSRRERRPVDARFAHRGERRREVALGEAAAVVVGDQRMVEVGRLGQAEQLLQQALDRASRRAGPRRARPSSRRSPRRRRRRTDDRRPARPCGRGWRRRCRSRVAVKRWPSASVQRRQAGERQRLGRIEPPAMRRRRAPLGIVGQGAAGAGIGASRRRHAARSATARCRRACRSRR